MQQSYRRTVPVIAHSPADRNANPSIVVVDDQPDLLAVMVDVLESEGYHALGVESPAALEETLRATRPDLILLDVVLPGTSGIDLATHLRANGYRDTPIIAMSASLPMARSADDSHLFQETLVKPFAVSTLLARIERYCSPGADE
ncbi:MAG: response regulator [Chloroflexi bacterium]|nr:response regulator [Chloroflexota bacterium]